MKTVRRLKSTRQIVAVFCGRCTYDIFFCRVLRADDIVYLTSIEKCKTQIQQLKHIVYMHKICQLRSCAAHFICKILREYAILPEQTFKPIDQYIWQFRQYQFYIA